MFEAPRPLPEPVAAPVVFGGHAVTGEPLPWSWAVERLSAARNYWLASAGAAGVPHVRPVWGVWTQAGLLTATYSVIGKDIDAGSEVVVHLEDAERVVILRTQAFRISDRGILTDLVERYRAKYDATSSVTDGGMLEYQGVTMPGYLLVPHHALGWRDDQIDRSTKWRFAR